jgi:hypothetical protein
MVLLSLWLNIVIAPRSAISNALHSKISLLQSLQVLSHKPSQALVVAVVVLVAVAQAVVAVVPAAALVVIAQAVVAVVMAQVLVQSLALAVVVQAIHVQPALLTHVLRVLLTHVQHALVIHVQQVVRVLRNLRLAANVATLAVAKNESP